MIGRQVVFLISTCTPIFLLRSRKRDQSERERDYMLSGRESSPGDSHRISMREDQFRWTLSPVPSSVLIRMVCKPSYSSDPSEHLR